MRERPYQGAWASVIARRRAEEEGARRSFLRERRRSRRIPPVRAADLQEEMTEQLSSVLSSPTKTAATQANSAASGASDQIQRDARTALPTARLGWARGRR